MDKVTASMWGGGRIAQGEGYQVDNLLDAKRAAILEARSGSRAEYTYPSKAVLYKDMVYFAPAPIQYDGLLRKVSVPNDYSKGFVIKLNGNNEIRRYVWDFHQLPPPDGVIGIETEEE